MAVNTGQPFCNTTDGYLCEGTDIKGSYFVIDKIEDIRADSPLRTNGALCYVITGTDNYPGNTFYRYTGSAWITHNMPHTIISPNEPSGGNIGDIWIVVADSN
jgi:hypothetical protein